MLLRDALPSPILCVVVLAVFAVFVAVEAVYRRVGAKAFWQSFSEGWSSVTGVADNLLWRRLGVLTGAIAFTVTLIFLVKIPGTH